MPPVIYRDLKSSNILLGDGLSPKLSDFGLARLGPEGDDTHVSTRVMGTYGYCASDYAITGKLSVKSDVYSFGILLLELVSGRKPIERLPSGAKRTITEWAEPLIARGRLGDLVDPRLRGAFDAAQLARVVECAALCVQGEPDRRPDMRTVVRILRGENAAAATVGRAGKGDQKVPVRIESVKYADRLMEMDKSSSYYDEPQD